MPAGLVLQYVLFKKIIKTLKKAAVYSHFEIPKPLRLAYFMSDSSDNKWNNTCRVLCCNMSVQKMKVFKPYYQLWCTTWALP